MTSVLRVAITLTIVSDRASHACEYSLMPEIAVFVSHEIDRAIAEKHGRQTDKNNWALACTIGNKYKGSDVASIEPSNGEIVRLHDISQVERPSRRCCSAC